MCLIGLRISDQGELLIAANRDEFADRPTQPMHWWNDTMLAGKDLRAGGTWLGLTRTGRFAAVTNVRDPAIKDHPVPLGSRGRIVSEFLQSEMSAEEFLEGLIAQLTAASPFNLLVGEIGRGRSNVWWLGGRVRRVEALATGHHTLSNAELNTPWPKSCRLHAALESTDLDVVRTTMLDQTPADEAALPSTGVPIDWEKRLSSILITGSDYHTRSTSLIQIRNDDVVAEEFHWQSDGQLADHVAYQFSLDRSPA